MSPAVIGQFDKIGEGVLVENKGELLVVACPVCDCRGDVEEDLEAHLRQVVLARGNVMSAPVRSYLGDHLCGFAKVGAPAHCVGLGQVVLDQTETNVVPHSIQLLVDFGIVVLKVLAYLRHYGSVGEDD